ncbi:LysR family transcriptional regulator [Burkholderiaceae bacterium FT117]|uniref:LysR family transcriptional regulator n=1 Tax=Zeimonas sediminis TaxID=2944268 RepID=UPI002342D450|nr:LysR family transcriptional regulator [Zeimonas sediminis]MCM5570942.1 LysR family transcriptional regulator [Zeimonas sediminis]
MLALQPLLAFSETAKHGGFAAAARELGTSPSALAKAVGRLEASLGLRLFHRSTRQVTLTEDGERLFQRCQRVLAELDELQTEAAGARAAPSGTLRIDMPVVYGRKVILPVLAELVRRHPALTLDVRLSDAFADLVQEGLDVAIRIGELPDSSLVARRFASQQLILVASPAYLRERGTPGTLDELAAHRQILFRLPGRGRIRPRQFSVDGRTVTLHPSEGLRFDDGDAMVQAAVLGMGVLQVPDYMAVDELAAGRLVELLPGHRPPPMPIHAVVPANRLVPARVRVLLEALTALGAGVAGAAPVRRPASQKASRAVRSQSLRAQRKPM